MNNNLNCAEAMDLLNSRIAIGLLLASFAYGLDASVYLLADPDNQVFKWISFSISMLAALWIFRAAGPAIWKKFKSKSFTHQEPESFITETFHKAMIKSWIVTIAALMVLKVLEQFISQFNLPVEFYINGLVFVMLFTTGVTFLLTIHANEEDGLQDDENQEELI